METSGKSNPRTILGAQRARNKTVVMGADQLQAFRNDAEVSSNDKEVADLLGMVDPVAEAEKAEDRGFDESLLDAFSGEELPEEQNTIGEQVASALPEQLVDGHDALDFGDSFESLDEEEHIASHNESHDEVEVQEAEESQSELDDTHPVEEETEAGRSRIIRFGSSMGVASEVPDTEGFPEADGAALEMREIPAAVESIPTQARELSSSHHKRLKRECSDALVGFLVSFDTDPRGAFFELREGRVIVTSESVGAAPCLVVADASVSPMHAIMKIVSGEPLHILDQLSEFGTRIWHSDSNREECLSGDKGLAGHGDVVYFGERKFHVCLVSIEMEGNE